MAVPPGDPSIDDSGLLLGWDSTWIAGQLGWSWDGGKSGGTPDFLCGIKRTAWEVPRGHFSRLSLCAVKRWPRRKESPGPPRGREGV